MSVRSDLSQAIPPLNELDHIQGQLYATVILMEYGDYECPQSGQAHVMIKAMKQQLGEQLCFVFRHFPKRSRSLRAAESAEAAAAQNKFWEMHELLFERQQNLEDSDLVQYADCLQLDIPLFLQAMAERVHVSRIEADLESGRCNGVLETPTFFIGVRHEGTQNLETLLLAILQSNRISPS